MLDEHVDLHAVDDQLVLPGVVVPGVGRPELPLQLAETSDEVSAQGPNREQFRLFCILENGTPEELTRRGLSRPTIAVITGMRKPWMTPFSEHDYEAVRRLGDDHRGHVPRRIRE